jgi:hypothetical protein
MGCVLGFIHAAEAFSLERSAVFGPQRLLHFLRQEQHPQHSSTSFQLNLSHGRRHVVLHQQRRRNENNNDDDNEQQQNPDLFLIDAIETVLHICAQPTPGLSGLKLGFPLALLFVSAVVSTTQAAVTILLFALYAGLGRQVVLRDSDTDDNERDEVSSNNNNDDDTSTPIDLFALPAAIVSAALLVPYNTDFNASDSDTFVSLDCLYKIGAVVLTAGVLVSLVQSNMRSIKEEVDAKSPEKRLLDLWDDMFKQSKNNKNNDDDEDSTTSR